MAARDPQRFGKRPGEGRRVRRDDSMIVASALLQGCDTLYSAHPHHRQRVDELLIRNPFAAGK